MTKSNTGANLAPRNAIYGNVAPSQSRLVRGVGHNDVAYPVYSYNRVSGRQKRLWVCPFYAAWKDMLDRCYSPKFHDRYPTYRGCSVEPSWLSLSEFSGWMVMQDHEGKHLDKDILAPGNKVYSPDTCVFIPTQLNNFLTDAGASRGEWPIGVCRYKRNGKFVSKCNNPFTGKYEHIGYFPCPDAAHKAWRARKHEHACAYADMQTDPRIAAALRSRYDAKASSEFTGVAQ